MKYILRIRLEARTDLAEGYDYYQAEQPGLGDEFHNEVAIVLRQLHENPNLYPRAKRSPYRKAVV